MPPAIMCALPSIMFSPAGATASRRTGQCAAYRPADRSGEPTSPVSRRAPATTWFTLSELRGCSRGHARECGGQVVRLSGLRMRMAVSYVLVTAAAVVLVDGIVLGLLLPRMLAGSNSASLAAVARQAGSDS